MGAHDYLNSNYLKSPVLRNRSRTTYLRLWVVMCVECLFESVVKEFKGSKRIVTV